MEALSAWILLIRLSSYMLYFTLYLFFFFFNFSKVKDFIRNDEDITI